MIFDGTVGEVDPRHIETGAAHVDEHIELVRGRPEGRHNFGSAKHGYIVECGASQG
jgi:hypothetical protein